MSAPATVSIAPHPSMFNRALRALGVDSVTVSESDGQTKVTTRDGHLSDLVNALVIAHTRLLAAESNASGVERSLTQLRLVTGLHIDDRTALDEAREELRRISDNLTGLARVTR